MNRIRFLESAPVNCKMIAFHGFCKTTDPNFFALIHEWCQHTCGLCCQDEDKYFCSTYLKPLCNKPGVRNQCPETCNACSGKLVLEFMNLFGAEE